MGKKKEGKEDYATDDPTDTSAKEQEDMVKEAIKKFKSLGWAKLSLAVSFCRNYGTIWFKSKPRGFNVWCNIHDGEESAKSSHLII